MAVATHGSVCTPNGQQANMGSTSAHKERTWGMVMATLVAVLVLTVCVVVLVLFRPAYARTQTHSQTPKLTARETKTTLLLLT
jgi:heme/copper-type cytochrome/quinol oxidase subunit 2